MNGLGYSKYCYVNNPNNTMCATALSTNVIDNGYAYRVWKKSGIQFNQGWRCLYSGCIMEFAQEFSSAYNTIPSCTNGNSLTWYKP